MYKIDVVCPIYKNFEQLKYLYSALKQQENIEIGKFVFPFTISNTDVDKDMLAFLNENGITYFTETMESFSHSLTREKAIRDYCENNVILLLSQDVVLMDNHCVEKLVSKINDQVVYAFGRQICLNKSIEKYIRRKNYPEKGYVVSQHDIDKMQLQAFFASDAFSALNRKAFMKIGGYRDINTMMGEDMLFSKFLLDEGYSKEYVAEAVVEHSHKYTIKQLYKRYYDTGIFHAQVSVFDGYHAGNSGMQLAFYVLGQALKHFDLPVLFRWLPDMCARYFGMKKGRKSVK